MGWTSIGNGWRWAGAAALCLWAGGDARAEDCGNIAETGICQDPKTLLYCARGELKTMACAEGEICVEHEFFGEEGSGCVATRYAGCGDITEAGVCLGDAHLLYCENNQVAEKLCGAGWTCGLVTGDAAEGTGDYYDCVASVGPSDVEPVEPDPSEPEGPAVEDDDDVVEEDPAGGTRITGPTVQSGGAPAAGELGAGGGACAGGGEAPMALALAALALTASRRRTARSR